jgi:copper chaperone CopZ
MEKTTLAVPNISCGHCVATIQRELDGMEGVSKVEGNSESKEIVVEWEAPASLDQIKAALKDINYPAAD